MATAPAPAPKTNEELSLEQEELRKEVRKIAKLGTPKKVSTAIIRAHKVVDCARRIAFIEKMKNYDCEESNVIKVWNPDDNSIFTIKK